MILQNFALGKWVAGTGGHRDLLDSVTGNAFVDDHQVARLLVERCVGKREGIFMRIAAMN